MKKSVAYFSLNRTQFIFYPIVGKIFDLIQLNCCVVDRVVLQTVSYSILWLIFHKEIYYFENLKTTFSNPNKLTVVEGTRWARTWLIFSRNLNIVKTLRYRCSNFLAVTVLVKMNAKVSRLLIQTDSLSIIQTIFRSYVHPRKYKYSLAFVRR